MLIKIVPRPLRNPNILIQLLIVFSFSLKAYLLLFSLHAGRGSLATPSMARGGHRNPLVHWTKVQSELAYILYQNVC
jgi:hypothetical protein